MSDETTGYTGPVRFDLIDAEIAWAEAEEAKGEMSAWNQGNWVTTNAPCGTAYCIAGHLAAQDGWQPAQVQWWYGIDRENWRKARSRRKIWLLGADLLGIKARRFWGGEEDLPYLFTSSNTVADLKRIRDNYARAEGYPTKYDQEVAHV